MSEENVEDKTGFEDGKQVEDYIKDLNSLEIEPEHSPEATQRMETVAEAPVRNQKEQKVRRLEKPKEEVPEKQAVVPQVEVAPIVPVQPAPTAQETQAIPEPPPTQQIPQSAPVPEQKLMTIEQYINLQGDMVKQQYIENGELAKKAFIENSYRNLVAVIQGDVALVPRQQLQSEPQQAPIESNETDRQIHNIDIALNDPLIQPEHKALLERKKLKLLGISLEDITPPQQAPVNPKPVNNGKQKKPLTRANKAVLGCMAIAVVVLVVLVIGFLA